MWDYFNLDRGHNINTDDLIRITGEEGGTIRAPGQTGAMRSPAGPGAILLQSELLRPEGIHDNLRFQIPNLDALVGRGAQPVPVGREDEGVDDLPGVERVQALALVEVPQHRGAVLPPRRAEAAVGRNAHGVEVSGVPDEVVAELAVREGPDLHEAIPPARDDEGHRLGRAEADAGHPLGVALGVGADGVLALPEGVPKLDGLVAGSAHDLAVVHAERHGQDVLRVSDEATGGTAAVDLPKAEGSVPASRQRELSVAADDDVGHEVGVSAEGALGVAVGIVLSGVGVGQAPDEDGLVAGGGEDEVGILGGGGDGRDPVAVAA